MMIGKKLIGVMVILTMMISLAACGGQETASTGSDDTKGSSTNEQAGNGDVSDEEPYTVAIQVVTLPGTEFEGLEDREAAINAIIEPAINCRVDIQEVWISELNQKTSMAAAGGEKLDILHVGTVSPLSSMVGSEMLIDMKEDDLLKIHGQGIIELFGEDLLASGKVAGKQLAIPAKTYNANAKGFYYNKSLADAAGITVPEKIESLAEMTELLVMVKDNIPDVMPFYTGEGTNNTLAWMANYASFGGNSSYGVLLDEQNNHNVTNLYASDLYREYALTMYEWSSKGLQPGDPTDTGLPQDYFNAAKLFCVVADFNEGVKTNIRANNPEIEIGWVEMVAPKVTNASVTEYMWGIYSDSVRPDKAMAFLNLLYTDAELANILSYGLEGANYSFVEGSDQVVQINGTYLPTFYIGGDTEEMYIKSPATDDYLEQCAAFEATATVSPILGYVFDDSGFQTESSVITSTLQEYLPQIANGMADSEEDMLALLDAFNDKLLSSGIDEVIEANQTQLDAFLEGK